jgi:hypothetical protein
MKLAMMGQDLRLVWLACKRGIEGGGGYLVAPQLQRCHAPADHRFQVPRPKRQGTFKTLSGLLGLPEPQLRHAAIAIGVGKVGLQSDGAVMQFDHLVGQAEVHQRIAEIGQRDRQAGFERDGLLPTGARASS